MPLTIDEILESTGNLYQPLKLEHDESFEQSQKQQKPIKLKSVPIQSSNTSWQHRDRGTMKALPDDQVLITSPARYETWPEGAPADGDYIQFGQVTAFKKLNCENWQDFNKLTFEIKNDCQNIINPNITLALKNDGQVKVPDEYLRTGFHAINVQAGTTTYWVDISDLPRDAITEISFTSAANGSYMNLPGKLAFVVGKIQLVKTAEQIKAEGWQPQMSKISYSQIGYPSQGKKTAILADDVDIDKKFLLIPAESFDSVFEGQTQKVTTKIGNFAVLDFSEFSQPGSYYLKVGEIQTPAFTITSNEKLWQSTLLQSLNFIYSERCGSPVPGIHGTCHEDVIAKHQGTTISFNGGWHDAGDLSQQTVHTAEVTLSLFKLAKAMKNRDPQFAQRVRQEAEWGLDFVLKTRFGDGYRATSAGVSRWTDNQIGNMDDAQARVHNNPLEN